MRLFVFFILIFLCFDFSFSQNEKNINGDIFLFQGNTAYRKGDFQQAEELYRKGLLMPSEHKSQGYFNLANSLYNQKKYDLAENEYINALNLLEKNGKLVAIVPISSAIEMSSEKKAQRKDILKELLPGMFFQLFRFAYQYNHKNHIAHK